VFKRLSPYLEQQILSASPLELVALSYQHAIDAVREAREKLAGKDNRGRVRAIARAQAIIVELHRALNFDAGDGTLAKELSRLYHYLMQRLLEASRQENDAKLAEVFSLLCTLGEAWEQTARENVVAHAASSASSSPSFAWETVDLEQASQCSVSF
jgi:flagellar protein FliS